MDIVEVAQRICSVGFNGQVIEELAEMIGKIETKFGNNQTDRVFLQNWITRNFNPIDTPLLGALALRLRDAFLLANKEETEELLNLFLLYAKGVRDPYEFPVPKSLPLCDPEPVVLFSDRIFSFVGCFVFGSRKNCELLVKARGGQTGVASQNTQYLVIGTFLSDGWKDQRYGRQIMSAKLWRTRGLPIGIISEKLWLEAF